MATHDGAIALEADGRTWIVLPTRALWIPAGVDHSVGSVGATEMTTLWLDPARCPVGWDHTTVVAVGLLETMLVGRLLDPTLSAPARTRTEAVLFDVLEPIQADVLDLAMPTDDRARRVAQGILFDPADDRTILAWGRAVGASGRTLQRALQVRDRPLLQRVAHPRAGRRRAAATAHRPPDRGDRRRRRLHHLERVRGGLPQGHGPTPERLPQRVQDPIPERASALM